MVRYCCKAFVLRTVNRLTIGAYSDVIQNFYALLLGEIRHTCLLLEVSLCGIPKLFPQHLPNAQQAKQYAFIGGSLKSPVSYSWASHQKRRFIKTRRLKTLSKSSSTFRCTSWCKADCYDWRIPRSHRSSQDSSRSQRSRAWRLTKETFIWHNSCHICHESPSYT